MKKFFKGLFQPDQRPNAPEMAPKTTPSHPVGYEILYEGANPIMADIVFVHGLRGHRLNTWTKEGICWPKDLLPNERALSNVRILSFGYDSRVVDFGGHASLISLFKHSITLLNGLCSERDDTNRPIIFVAHSLGGLIVKDAIHYADTHRSTRPDLATILDATRGVMFLGTPHRGSAVTTLPKLVASIVQAVQDVNVDLIRDLERESQTLDRIGDSFAQILNKRTFTVYSFEEELALGGKKIVEGVSAVIGDAYERRDTIHANHINMVKFSDRTDDGYRKVLSAIKVLLRERLQSAGQSM